MVVHNSGEGKMKDESSIHLPASNLSCLLFFAYPVAVLPLQFYLCSITNMVYIYDIYQQISLKLEPMILTVLC